MYWFRTPPYVKVGRAALDDEVKRRLEEQYPDIAFDWNRILREPPQLLPEHEAARRKEHRDAREARRKRTRVAEEESGFGVRASAADLSEYPDEAEVAEPPTGVEIAERAHARAPAEEVEPAEQEGDAENREIDDVEDDVEDLSAAEADHEENSGVEMSEAVEPASTQEGAHDDTRPEPGGAPRRKRRRRRRRRKPPVGKPPTEDV